MLHDDEDDSPTGTATRPGGHHLASPGGAAGRRAESYEEDIATADRRSCRDPGGWSSSAGSR
ncbi:hypothetical protein [Kineococcus rubinsiae]|uniref:hypothetical protein n=1 Tax=Kineococcus rubinsiae TaxID=2609562 RepID=UPI0014318012|nr:hypothetical protein [Kineococcus rubinsiae]NIZ91369.1 hypothetical protein [Kineococcus rubinsiae]